MKQDLGGEIKRLHRQLIDQVLTEATGAGQKYPEDRIRQTYGLEKPKAEDDPMSGLKAVPKARPAPTPLGQAVHGGSTGSGGVAPAPPPPPTVPMGAAAEEKYPVIYDEVMKDAETAARTGDAIYKINLDTLEPREKARHYTQMGVLIGNLVAAAAPHFPFEVLEEHAELKLQIVEFAMKHYLENENGWLQRMPDHVRKGTALGMAKF